MEPLMANLLPSLDDIILAPDWQVSPDTNLIQVRRERNIGRVLPRSPTQLGGDGVPVVPIGLAVAVSSPTPLSTSILVGGDPLLTAAPTTAISATTVAASSAPSVSGGFGKPVPVTAGHRYRAFAWVKAASAARLRDVTVRIYWINDGAATATWDEATITESSNQLRLVDVIANAPAGATSAYMEVAIEDPQAIDTGPEIHYVHDMTFLSYPAISEISQAVFNILDSTPQAYLDADLAQTHPTTPFVRFMDVASRVLNHIDVTIRAFSYKPPVEGGLIRSIDSGLMTAATSRVITDHTKTWKAHSLAGHEVRISGQYFQIEDNTENTFTLDGDLFVGVGTVAPKGTPYFVAQIEASDLVDPQRAIDSWLPWLGQHIGVIPNKFNPGFTPWAELEKVSAIGTPTWGTIGNWGATDITAPTWRGIESYNPMPTDLVQVLRDQISTGSGGFRSGTLPSMIAMAKSLLTGQRQVTITVGVGGAGTIWDMTILTLLSETPNVADLMRAVQLVTPAGIILHHDWTTAPALGLRQVQTWGWDQGGFGAARADIATPSGESFASRQWTGPEFAIGTEAWATVELPDGKVATSGIPFTNNQGHRTGLQLTLHILDPADGTMIQLVVPTTTGVTSPIGANGKTGGGMFDDVAMMHFDGEDRIVACQSTGYANWNIAINGMYPMIAVFSKIGGHWQYDAARSWTTDRLQASNPTLAATALPSATSPFGESYYKNFGPNEIAITPHSNQIITANYYASYVGHQSGSYYVIDPMLGLVGYYEMPNPIAPDGTVLHAAPRAITTDPTSSFGDERFNIIYDMTAGNGLHAIQEFSYDGTSTITVKSPAYIPTADTNRYTQAEYDSDGNLWVGTSPSIGLTSFNASPVDVFLKAGGERAALTATTPGGSWATTQFQLQSRPDLSLGSTARGGGNTHSANWLGASRNTMALTGADGRIQAVYRDTSFIKQTNLVTNPGLATDTSGWAGYLLTSTIARVTDADFTSGHALELTAANSGTIGTNYQNVAVAPSRDYMFTVDFKSITTARSARLVVAWLDASLAIISQDTGDTNATSTTSVVGLTYSGTAPANAAYAQIRVAPQAVVVSEVFRFSNVQMRLQPVTYAPLVHTNMSRLANGASVSVWRGNVGATRLWLPVARSETSSTRPCGPTPSPWAPCDAYFLDQWITSVDIAALLP